MALNDRQKLFCLEYLKDLNATQAAIRAGYKPETANKTGPRLLVNVGVSKEITKLNAERFKKVTAEGVDVIQELGNIAMSDISDYVEMDNTGNVQAKKLEDINPAARRAISQIEVTEDINNKGKVLTRKTKFKLWSKDKALENLGRHGKLFVDRREDKVDELSTIKIEFIKPDDKSDNSADS